MAKIFKAITSLFKAPKIPDIAKAVMPDPGSASSKIAASAKLEKRRKEGRQGTIYSGAAYTGNNLAGTA